MKIKLLKTQNKTELVVTSKLTIDQIKTMKSLDPEKLNIRDEKNALLFTVTTSTSAEVESYGIAFAEGINNERIVQTMSAPKGTFTNVTLTKAFVQRVENFGTKIEETVLTELGETNSYELDTISLEDVNLETCKCASVMPAPQPEKKVSK